MDLIKRFEGLRTKAYRDPVGIWTIGYGHTSAAGPPDVHEGLKITAAEAEAILHRDLEKFENAVLAEVTVPLNENQFAALVSFAFNVGIAGFRRSSVLARVNAGNHEKVPQRLKLWNKAGGKVLRGLVRRRRAEGELYMSDAVPSTVSAASSGRTTGLTAAFMSLLRWLMRMLSTK